MGGLVANIGGFVDENSRAFFEALGGEQGLEDAFMAAEWSFIGVFFAAFAITTVLRLRGEESAGRAEGLCLPPDPLALGLGAPDRRARRGDRPGRRGGRVRRVLHGACDR